MNARPRAFNSTLPAPTQPMKRSDIRKPKRTRRGGARERRRWKIRKAQRFARQFHSTAFVEFGKARHCQSCGAMPIDSDTENSHSEPRSRGATWERIFRQCKACHAKHPDPKQRDYTQLDVEKWIWEHRQLAFDRGIITATELSEAIARQLPRIEALS